jgi:site-specific recombinase XerD
MADTGILDMVECARIQLIENRAVPQRVVKDELSIDDVKVILGAPNTSLPLGLRDCFYMSLLYDTACRDQEIRNLTTKSIRTNGKAACVDIIGKGSKYRSVPLSDDVLSIYRRYLEVFHPEGSSNCYLFYTSRKGVIAKMSADNSARMLKKYERMVIAEKGAGIPHLHPHLFRHARALHLYRAGMPLELVSQWLGHAQMETTLIYAYADEEMKRAAVNKITAAHGSVFTGEEFLYKGDDEIIRKLYGLR